MALKVSIITATYNSVNTFEMCANSVLNQTYSNIEYIIVDGQSNDGTIEIIKSIAFNHNNVNWISEKDNGIYDALNKGIELATGDIIGFVHSDDFLSNKTIISSIVEYFKIQNADGIYGDLHYVSKDNINKVVRNWISKPFKSNLLKRGWMPPHPTLYLKSEVFKVYGGFDLNFDISADYDFISRIFKQPHLNFYYLPITIVKMRIGGASNRNFKNILKKTQEDYYAVKKNQTGNWLTIIFKNVSKLNQFVN